MTLKTVFSQYSENVFHPETSRTVDSGDEWVNTGHHLRYLHFTISRRGNKIKRFTVPASQRLINSQHFHISLKQTHLAVKRFNPIHSQLDQTSELNRLKNTTNWIVILTTSVRPRTRKSQRLGDIPKILLMSPLRKQNLWRTERRTVFNEMQNDIYRKKLTSIDNLSITVSNFSKLFVWKCETSGAIRITNGLPTQKKCWRKEFFFVLND